MPAWVPHQDCRPQNVSLHDDYTCVRYGHYAQSMTPHAARHGEQFVLTTPVSGLVDTRAPSAYH